MPTIESTIDTFVRGGSSSATAMNEVTLDLTANPSSSEDWHKVAVRFDLTAIVGGFSLASINMEVYAADGYFFEVDIYGIKEGMDTAWDETATWDSIPNNANSASGLASGTYDVLGRVLWYPEATAPLVLASTLFTTWLETRAAGATPERATVWVVGRDSSQVNQLTRFHSSEGGPEGEVTVPADAPSINYTAGAVSASPAIVRTKQYSGSELATFINAVPVTQIDTAVKQATNLEVHCGT